MVLSRAVPGLTRTDYVSDDVFHDERRRIGKKGFAFVGRASDLALPGQFVAIEPFGERIVVYRTRDLELRAFVDRCIHRALPMTVGSDGTLAQNGLVCRYHGLRYDDAGRVCAPKSSIPIFARTSLSERAVAESRNDVFVALSEDAHPRDFERYEEGAPPWLTESFHASLALVHRHRFRSRANWKLIVENFQESWHFPTVHEGLHARTPHGRTTSVTLGRHWLGGTMRFQSGTETVAPSRTLGSRKYVAGPGWRKHVYDAFMYPFWLTSLQPDYFLTYRLVPLSPLETEVQADIWGHVASVRKGPAEEWDAIRAFWDRTNAEDREIVERQMRGVLSPTFERMHLHPSEEDGLRAFHRRYLRDMRGARGRGH
ncbi:MAG: aromatic ring-hydroxylating dioxygenase subunit alpha [Polyangiaceae bacterium]